MAINTRELLRFTTAGSVDDGKSTLIGRLLYDSKSRSEERRVGKECRFRWWPYHYKKKFLAQLFVSPDRQSDGIGNQLIRRAFAHAQMRGASIRALITFTFNNVSQGLYIRHGLFPRCPIYMVSVSRDRLTSKLAEPRLHLESLVFFFKQKTAYEIST